jgi:hypothetical protein
VSDERTLIEEFTTLRTATMRSAGDIIARETDGSFLEKTLRDALAAQLPRAGTEHPLSLDRALWPGRLGGVDILYVTDDDTRVGVETKVWDVADSLYDIFKLAAGTQSGKLTVGLCAVAGRGRDWRVASAVRDMSATTAGACIEWDIATVLRDHQRDWERIWTRTAIRPVEIPKRIRTLAGEPVTMPRVPDHEIRLIGVQAVGQQPLRLDQSGSAIDDGTPDVSADEP